MRLGVIGRKASLPSFTQLFGKHIPISVPPDLASEATLLAYLGVSPKELKKIWWYRDAMYKNFSIAKGSGKLRHISAPDNRLKILQRKLAPLLDQLYRVRNPVHGFVLDRSVRSNAEAHMCRRHVVNIDLKDFFPSITENRVKGLLRALGVDHRVSEIVARLCCLNGHLPQGAPTSPILSNMICFRLDTVLLQIAKTARAIYTRYADDITFSTFQPPVGLFEAGVPPSGRFAPEALAVNLLKAMADNGFVINPDKAHYADRHARRMVTGLKINELINVDRRYVRNLRAALHSVEVIGVKEAQIKFQSKYGGGTSLSAHLAGKISWLGFIKGSTDPLVRSIMLRFNHCFPDSPLKVKPTEIEMRDRAVWLVEHDGDAGTQGTCFFLKDIGLVTAAHCVENVETVEIYHPSKTSNSFKVKVLKRHELRDLALLEPALPKTEYFELTGSEHLPVADTPTVALGYPGYGPGDKLNVRSGTVSSLPKKSGVQLVEVTQKIAQGMSGGPLLDAHGNVIGINHKGGPEMARDFAVHIKELTAWLAE
ncbi:trypsin-like peptidase domain-containing protein [Pleomorphomonas sp. NRK KF1]|uniref:trypsin-like peptidase domain-containing protein n=1 Tax=Pleomorphomonas sp. NRK KF1 TaxID=2943000 RepID=UPI0020432079|nr:trypsin-like peptidase domain-containing protein [Pleomorphomonas sp. NRK KF1]MCM5555353.1 reverse transcriptase domain-containing protein [Pleomorphomonas sp. NRK KF1]